MINKLKKTKPVKAVATIEDSGYIVLSDGSVARLLKPVVVNNKPSYNMVIDGTLRRITSKKLLTAALVTMKYLKS
jgi:hypothetical protein